MSTPADNRFYREKQTVPVTDELAELREKVRLQRLLIDTMTGIAHDRERTMAEQVRVLGVAHTTLLAAKAEIEWWAEEHGCCLGHEDLAISTIDDAIALCEGR